MIVKKCCFPSESTMYIHIYIYIYLPKYSEAFLKFYAKTPILSRVCAQKFCLHRVRELHVTLGDPRLKESRSHEFPKKKQIPNLGGGDYNKWRLHISGWLKSENADLGGGNSNIFVFSSRKLGKMNPFWRVYFSDGLKPPTSNILWKIPKNLEQW